LLVPDAEGDLFSGALRAHGGKGGAEHFGHLRLGHLVASDAIVDLFCFCHSYLPPPALGRAL